MLKYKYVFILFFYNYQHMYFVIDTFNVSYRVPYISLPCTPEKNNTLLDASERLFSVCYMLHNLHRAEFMCICVTLL